MIQRPAFPVEPWGSARPSWTSITLGQTESVFALANGHIGLRGNLDEGEPHGLPGTYLNSFYEERPLPYAEAGYGYPESGQTIVNVTNGKLIRLLVDDEPLDVRTASSGPTSGCWICGPAFCRAGRVGLAGREGCSGPFQAAGLVGPAGGGRDQLHGRAARRPCRWSCSPSWRRTRRCRCRAATPARGSASDAAAGLGELWLPDAPCDAPRPPDQAIRAADGGDDGPRGGTGPEATETLGVGGPRPAFTVTADFFPGEPLRLVKLLAYGWSSERSAAALRDQVGAAWPVRVHRAGRSAGRAARL